MSFTLSRRNALKVGAGAVATSAVAGTAATHAIAQDSGWTGEITFYAQAYTPNNKLPNANQLTAFQEVADAYQADHPGITITFINEDFDDYLQTVRVKSSGRELWDIFWVQSGNINGTLPRGIALDLNSAFDEPNPYIEGNTAWRDAMNQTVLGYTTAPSGEQFVLDGDWVGTAFFYNKDLFEQAGITEAPTTWTEILEVSQTLKDAGITAFTGAYDHSWFGRHFWSDFYSPEYEMLSGCDGMPGQSPQDEAAAINAGILSTEQDRFIGWWPIFKQLTDLGGGEFVAQDPGAVSEEIQNEFATGNAAIFYSGSWIPRNLQTVGIEFELGAFNFPVLTPEEAEWATGTDVSAVVGGPNAAYQYAISTPESNKTLEEEGKADAVMDFLRYIGTPEVAEKVINELGSFAPTWPNTTAAEGLEAFAEQAQQGLNVVNVGNSSAALGANIQKNFNLFLSGNLEFDQAKQLVQQELDRAVKDYQTSNPDIDINTCMEGQ